MSGFLPTRVTGAAKSAPHQDSELGERLCAHFRECAGVFRAPPTAWMWVARAAGWDLEDARRLWDEFSTHAQAVPPDEGRCREITGALAGGRRVARTRWPMPARYAPMRRRSRVLVTSPTVSDG